MKAEERHELETNSLAEGVSNLVTKAKSGQLVSYRIAGIVLLLVTVFGTWWYITNENKKGNSFRWAEIVRLNRTGSQTDLSNFASENKDNTATKVARLEAARILLGPEGIYLLQPDPRDVRDSRDRRNKGIENIEKAREELLKLGDEFKGDGTMQASCWTSAAEAELALVGIPKDATGGENNTRGTVKQAADLYRKAAAAIGEKTASGEQLIARATQLEADAATILELGKNLHLLVSPPPSFTFPQPNGPIEGPKPPTTPIPTPTPPEMPKGTDGPKAPDKPITVPPVTPENKAPDSKAPTPSVVDPKAPATPPATPPADPKKP